MPNMDRITMEPCQTRWEDRVMDTNNRVMMVMILIQMKQITWKVMELSKFQTQEMLFLLIQNHQVLDTILITCNSQPIWDTNKAILDNMSDQ